MRDEAPPCVYCRFDSIARILGVPLLMVKLACIFVYYLSLFAELGPSTMLLLCVHVLEEVDFVKQLLGV